VMAPPKKTRGCRCASFSRAAQGRPICISHVTSVFLERKIPSNAPESVATPLRASGEDAGN
jgi:hypothetical protein